ncbi:MAG TPA: CpsD/CapB family tyrosine-protein kinase [Pyrinomonadaceae bacterium]
MGRVYDALKRAAETNGAKGQGSGGDEQSRGGATERAAGNGANGHGAGGDAAHASASSVVAPLPAPEQLLGRSAHITAPGSAPAGSAPNERTGRPVGSALPDMQASRVAGATLGAAGSMRADAFQSLEVTSARVEPHIIAVTQPNSPHAERFRSLRTRVLHAGERKKMQAFVITSAGIMEGKTMTAVNLSWLLAQTDGVRALLIDADLRKPTAGDYLGIDAPFGLSEVLAGEATLEESIIRLTPAGLHLLPGGEPRDNVAELLSGPRFGRVLKELRGLYDYIIIDTPPLGIFTDATLVISRADGVLVVARAGRTRFSALERLLEPIPRERVLGIVLNGADEPPGENYNNNYYYRRPRYQRRDEAPAETAEVVEEKA